MGAGTCLARALPRDRARGSAATGSPPASGRRSSASPPRWSGSPSGRRALNAAKLLALIEAGPGRSRARARGELASGASVTLLCSRDAGSAPVDVVVDAVLPGPGRGRARRPARRPDRATATCASPRAARARRHDDGGCRRARRRPLARPGGDRPADRGLRDRQRHAQSQPCIPTPTAGRGASCGAAPSARPGHRRWEPVPA